MRSVRLFLILILAAGASIGTARAQPLRAGPLYDEFELTLKPGYRTEALGPLFYDQQAQAESIWALPPLLSYTRDPAANLKEFNFLYPLMTYDRYGDQYRWQLLQLWSFAGGPMQEVPVKDRFTLFPIYFHQRSVDPSLNYTALFPIYGHLQHRLFRDEIFFVTFPLFVETKKQDVVTDNYLFPLFHLRHGDGLKGWQFWPLAGHEQKVVTTQTNGFKDVETVPGRDSLFLLWPLFFNQHSGIGSQNPLWQQGSIPLYWIERSPLRDSTTLLWPLLSWVDDREKKYKEWDTPWPLIVMARGEGKTTTRVWPLFSRSHNATLESDFYLWPIYKYNRAQLDPLDRERTRILFFLYSDVTDRNMKTGASERRVNLWPFFMQRREFNGNRRLQVLALLEPFAAGSHKIERDYSPLWSLWRAEQNPKTGAASQSLLWNLYRRDTTPASRKVSLLFGLFQYQSSPAGQQTKLFFIPVSKSRAGEKFEPPPP
jgi:hypothetical protein